MTPDEKNAVFKQTVGDYRVTVMDDKQGGVYVVIRDSELTTDFLNLHLPSPGKFVAPVVPVSPVAASIAAHTKLDVIVNVVASHFNVPSKHLLGTTRVLRVSEARHVAVWLAKQLTTYSLLELGNYFGKRDHSSILYAINKIGERQKTDQDFAKVIGFIRDKIRKGETGDAQHETGKKESSDTGK